MNIYEYLGREIVKRLPLDSDGDIVYATNGPKRIAIYIHLKRGEIGVIDDKERKTYKEKNKDDVEVFKEDSNKT